MTSRSTCTADRTSIQSSFISKSTTLGTCTLYICKSLQRTSKVSIYLTVLEEIPISMKSNDRLTWLSVHFPTSRDTIIDLYSAFIYCTHYPEQKISCSNIVSIARAQLYQFCTYVRRPTVVVEWRYSWDVRPIFHSSDNNEGQDGFCSEELMFLVENVQSVDHIDKYSDHRWVIVTSCLAFNSLIDSDATVTIPSDVLLRNLSCIHVACVIWNLIVKLNQCS